MYLLGTKMEIKRTSPPYIPAPPIEPHELFPQPLSLGKCLVCGLILYPVMGYVCPRAGCPTGLGSSSFSNPNVST